MKILVHGFVLVTFIMLVALGTWQVKRMIWKKDMITEIAYKSTLPAEDISGVSEDQLTKYLYQPVLLKGSYHPSRELYVYSGKATNEAKTDGYYVYAPFALASGVNVLVNRGFISRTQKNIPVPDETDIVGVLLPNEHKKVFGVSNDLSHNIWLYLDQTEVEAYTDLKLSSYIVKQTKSKHQWPLVTPFEPTLYDQHLQYVITWYGLAVALAVIYGLRIRKKA